MPPSGSLRAERWLLTGERRAHSGDTNCHLDWVTAKVTLVRVPASLPSKATHKQLKCASVEAFSDCGGPRLYLEYTRGYGHSREEGFARGTCRGYLHDTRECMGTSTLVAGAKPL